MRSLGTGFASLLLGAGVAGLASLVHRLGSGLPWGLLLAVTGSTAGGLAVAAVGAGRLGILGYALGWGGTVLLVLAGRPEGDYLVAGDTLGWAFLLFAFGGVIAATMLGLMMVRPSGPQESRAGPRP